MIIGKKRLKSSILMYKPNKKWQKGKQMGIFNLSKKKVSTITSSSLRWTRCYECGGTGYVECDCTGGCGRKAADDDCPVCGGTGKHTCPVCHGRKKVLEE